ncbi:outer membrane protein [Candidatus Scalindua japonica]|uniref:Outer membrane protein n=1 Tax=Candidatus Scalindua japonica TaxID=1284222 RepID=A0A286U0W0_9BACT|nr:outer membrane protein [Candidatus Scalindua japonica]
MRKGEVLVEKPTLLLPPGSPQLDGFDFRDAYQQQQDMITNFFLVRGIEFPSLKYNNKTYSLDIFEDRLSKAIEQYTQDLQKEENVTSGLVIGPEDCWQFSVLIFICTQIVRSADNDIKSFRNRWNR